MESPLEKARKDPESMKARILNVARKIFGEYGFHGTTTRMIAQEVGIDISTLHYHWGEKQDLYEAVILATSPDTILPGRMIIANSADLGVHKADRYFWEILRKRLELDRLRHILLIDDFGANDQESDAYADRQKVENRRRQTVNLLAAVFGGEVRDFFFRLGPGADPPLRDRLIDEASRFIDRFLQYP